MTIQEITRKYKGKIDQLDLEILIAHSLGKTREFVLTYEDYEMPTLRIENLKLKISRRIKGEPIAYITGHKEFYGLDFIVNKYTLVPRPETELLVDSIINNQKTISNKNTCVVDVGTGSGCIITSIAKALKRGKWKVERADEIKYFAIDVSAEALKVAKKNAKLNGVEKKIKFLQGNLLLPFFVELKNLKAKKLMKMMPEKLIIVANLPYLSKEIYQSAPIDVKKFEPKTALYSSENGLAHYRKLFEQINDLLITGYQLPINIFLEISPEQKKAIAKTIKNIFPSAKIEFKKDLAGKWRTCKIEL